MIGIGNVTQAKAKEEDQEKPTRIYGKSLSQYKMQYEDLRRNY
jgi:hypothetical protein